MTTDDCDASAEVPEHTGRRGGRSPRSVGGRVRPATEAALVDRLCATAGGLTASLVAGARRHDRRPCRAQPGRRRRARPATAAGSALAPLAVQPGLAAAGHRPTAWCARRGGAAAARRAGPCSCSASPATMAAWASTPAAPLGWRCVYDVPPAAFRVKRLGESGDRCRRRERSPTTPRSMRSDGQLSAALGFARLGRAG